MAKAQVSNLLKELEKVADKDIARGILDYQTQYVLMYVEDIAIAFEDGFKKVMQRREKSGAASEKISKSIFTTAAKKGIQAVEAYVTTTGKKTHSLVTGLSKSGNKFLSFRQEGAIQAPFNILKQSGLVHINKFLKEEIGAAAPEGAEGSGYKIRGGQRIPRAPASDQAIFGQQVQRLHLDKRSVGAMQLSMAKDFLSKTPGWEEFAASKELNSLVELFGFVDISFGEDGYDGTKKVNFDIKQQIAIKVRANQFNPAGGAATDWVKNRDRLSKSMVSYLIKKGMADEKGSNSIREDAVAHARKEALKNITKSVFAKTKSKAKAVKRPKKNVKTSSKSSGPTIKRKKYNSKVKTAQRSNAGSKNNASLYTVMALINDKLPETVRKNMGAPRLENQTGRFASSVKLTDVIQTPQGFPSFGYTYRKDPYGVYERSSGTSRADPDRDPRDLIDASIREIAAGYALGRFYTRRV